MSFLFAGLMLALSRLLAPAGMIFYNGVVYFDISVLALILSTTAAYLLLLLFERLFAGRVDERRLYEITVTAGGRAVSCKGLADTGSDLREPFSGAPVIVCDRTLGGTGPSARARGLPGDPLPDGDGGGGARGVPAR